MAKQGMTISTQQSSLKNLFVIFPLDLKPNGAMSNRSTEIMRIDWLRVGNMLQQEYLTIVRITWSKRHQITKQWISTPKQILFSAHTTCFAHYPFAQSPFPKLLSVKFVLKPSFWCLWNEKKCNSHLTHNSCLVWHAAATMAFRYARSNAEPWKILQNTLFMLRRVS